jgi:penicillin-binding protein 2
MAFAPYELPEVAVAVIVENGGGGGAVAAPIARKFLEKYFFNRLIPRYYAAKDTMTAEAVDSSEVPFDLEAFQPLEILYPRETED